MGEITEFLTEGFIDLPEWIEDATELRNNSIQQNTKKTGYVRMHTTKNGRSLPIHAMDNIHIENMIDLLIDKMSAIKSSALYEIGESGDLFNLELNGIQKMDKKSAINIISDIMYKLEPYLAELVIRGNSAYIMNISQKLTDILGRNKITGGNLLT